MLCTRCPRGYLAGIAATATSRSRPPARGRARHPTAQPGAPSAAGGAPARARRLRAQGRQTLRKLLDAGLVAFEERGYHVTRVDDIVSEAGTSHGTFYLYFSNKEDLFRALVSDVTAEMDGLAESLPAIKPSKTGYEDLGAWIGKFYDLYARYHPVIRAWTEAAAENAELARTGGRVLRLLVDRLARRIEEVDPPQVQDPTAAAVALVAMVERAVSYSVVHTVPVKRDALVGDLAAIAHVGIFAGARRRRP